jgi:hypothetical protein
MLEGGKKSKTMTIQNELAMVKFLHLYNIFFNCPGHLLVHIAYQQNCHVNQPCICHSFLHGKNAVNTFGRKVALLII